MSIEYDIIFYRIQYLFDNTNNFQKNIPIIISNI